MLDYYGSIMKGRDEIIKDIINHYKDYQQDKIKEIVEELMSQKEIQEECSVSGWMVFSYKQSIEKMDEEIKKRKIISILNEKVPIKEICENIYTRSKSPDPCDFNRAELIARRGYENDRDPLDTAGMDTDDEEWIYENPNYEDYIRDHYNELISNDGE